MKDEIIILTLCGLMSCTHSEIKKIVSTYKNEKPDIICYYLDKADSTTYRKEAFYESGKPEYTGHVYQAKKAGTWIWWYENGNKKDQCKYSEGFYVDTVFHWYKNGGLREIQIVVNGMVRENGCCNCNGTIIRYYENGKLGERFTLIDDKLQGTSISYAENGDWKLETYKNDTLSGPTIEHFIDSNKVKIVAGQYKNGKESGVWKIFDKDSVLAVLTPYENGKVNGYEIQFYSSGKMKQKSSIKNGKYEGKVLYFDENEKVTKKEFYKNNKLIKPSSI